MQSSFLSHFTNPDKRRKLWELIKVAAAHHPHCDNYSKHVYTIKGVKTCRGCTIYYPTSTISLILVWFLPSSLFTRSPFELILIGAILALPALIHLTKIDKLLKIDRITSFLSKFLLGIGSGYLLRILFVLPLLFKIISLFLVISLSLIVQLVRFKYFWNDCKGCPELPYREKFNYCPGLRPINTLIDLEVVKYFETLTDQQKESLLQIEVE